MTVGRGIFLIFAGVMLVSCSQGTGGGDASASARVFTLEASVDNVPSNITFVAFRQGGQSEWETVSGQDGVYRYEITNADGLFEFIALYDVPGYDDQQVYIAACTYGELNRFEPAFRTGPLDIRTALVTLPDAINSVAADEWRVGSVQNAASRNWGTTGSVPQDQGYTVATPYAPIMMGTVTCIDGTVHYSRRSAIEISDMMPVSFSEGSFHESGAVRSVTLGNNLAFDDCVLYTQGTFLLSYALLDQYFVDDLCTWYPVPQGLLEEGDLHGVFLENTENRDKDQMHFMRTPADTAWSANMADASWSDYEFTQTTTGFTASFTGYDPGITGVENRTYIYQKSGGLKNYAVSQGYLEATSFAQYEFSAPVHAPGWNTDWDDTCASPDKLYFFASNHGLSRVFWPKDGTSIYRLSLDDPR